MIDSKGITDGTQYNQAKSHGRPFKQVDTEQPKVERKHSEWSSNMSYHKHVGALEADTTPVRN